MINDDFISGLINWHVFLHIGNVFRVHRWLMRHVCSKRLCNCLVKPAIVIYWDYSRGVLSLSQVTAIQPSHNSHNALDKCPTMHRFVTVMCTHRAKMRFHYESCNQMRSPVIRSLNGILWYLIWRLQSSTVFYRNFHGSLAKPDVI